MPHASGPYGFWQVNVTRSKSTRLQTFNANKATQELANVNQKKKKKERKYTASGRSCLLSKLFIKLIFVRKPRRGWNCSHVVLIDRPSLSLVSRWPPRSLAWVSGADLGRARAHTRIYTDTHTVSPSWTVCLFFFSSTRIPKNPALLRYDWLFSTKTAACVANPNANPG